MWHSGDDRHDNMGIFFDVFIFIFMKKYILIRYVNIIVNLVPSNDLVSFRRRGIIFPNDYWTIVSKTDGWPWDVRENFTNQLATMWRSRFPSSFMASLCRVEMK